MATHGLHRKWQSLTSCQRHTSKPIDKIFGMIDNVIDLNNLAKFGFGKIFPEGGTHTQHIRVRSFKKKLVTLFVKGAAKTSEQISTRNTSLVRVRSYSINEKYRSMTLTLKRSNSAILFDPNNFDPNFLENGTILKESVYRS